MGVKCKIRINNINEYYKSGESVQGTVKYVVNKPTEFTSIIASVKGKPFWVWYLHIPRTVYNESKTLVDQHMDLLGEKEGDSMTLPAGTYEKQFSFILPEEAPSTFLLHNICYFAFFVQVEFMKPNSSSVQKFHSDVYDVIMKPRGIEKMELHKENKLMLSKKTVTLLASIKKPFLYAGDDIEMVIHIIKNCPDLTIISTTIELMQFVTLDSYKSVGNEYVKILKRVKVKHLGLNRLQTMSKHNHTFTTAPDIFTTHSKKLRSEFKIRIILELPYPHEDMYMVIGIAIAEKIQEDDLEKENITSRL